MNYFRIISAPKSTPAAAGRKPFTLVKYFTFSSLILIFIGALVLSTLHTHLVRNLLVKKSEDFAKLLVENLNHQIFLQFIVPIYYQYGGKIQLRNPQQAERMDKIVRNTLHSFNVDMVIIYDLNNVISYSFNPEIIGEKDIGGTGYQKALAGESTTSLIQIGNFWEILFRLPRVSRITTFAPLRMEKPMSPLSGPVIGVVEIVQNVSADYKKIFRLQVLVILTSTLVMGIMFMVLRSVVKNGESIIDERTRERFRLKEELDRTRHLSAIGEMTAVISHEIRNPLGIIRSSAELLQKQLAQSGSQSQISSVIMEEATRMNEIITDFLAYARLPQAELAPCHLRDILNKNITFLQAELENGGYTIQLYCAPKVPFVTADATMLYQLFLNLMINAMQAMPGGGHIHVGIHHDTTHVRVMVKDEGGGIPEDVLEKIRDPFFSTKEKGTGLGLGIVEKILAAHKGSFLIENHPSGGAQATVILPIHPEPEKA